MLAVRQSLTYFRAEHYAMVSGLCDDFRNLPRPFSSLAYIENGGAVFTEEGEEPFPVAPGDILFIPAGSRYLSLWDATQVSHLFSCHFLLSPDSLFSLRHYRICRVSAVPGAEDAFRFLFTHRDDDTAGFDLVARFYSLLGAIYPYLPSADLPATDARVLPALTYMERHPVENYDVAFLASLCHVSPSHFYCCFRQATGQTPVTYKNRLAIRAAERLLCDGGLSVEQISEKCGFASASYFRRVFREVTGQSPLSYRKNRKSAL